MAVAAVVFDLYGTLLSIDRMRRHVEAAQVREAAEFLREWRRTQLEYAFLTSLAGAYADFDELTARALEHTCALRHVTLTPAARDNLAAAWRAMDPYDDVAPALQSLVARGIPLAVLTNGTPQSADAVLNRAGLRGMFADVLSVESVRVYKPDPRVYALVTARFDCHPGDVVFVSSNGWDAWGATCYGFRVAWCNRAGVPPAALSPGPAATLRSLSELEAVVAGG